MPWVAGVGDTQCAERRGSPRRAQSIHHRLHRAVPHGVRVQGQRLEDTVSLQGLCQANATNVGDAGVVQRECLEAPETHLN